MQEEKKLIKHLLIFIGIQANMEKITIWDKCTALFQFSLRISSLVTPVFKKTKKTKENCVHVLLISVNMLKSQGHSEVTPSCTSLFMYTRLPPTPPVSLGEDSANKERDEMGAAEFCLMGYI